MMTQARTREDTRLYSYKRTPSAVAGYRLHTVYYTISLHVSSTLAGFVECVCVCVCIVCSIIRFNYMLTLHSP